MPHHSPPPSPPSTTTTLPSRLDDRLPHRGITSNVWLTPPPRPPQSLVSRTTTTTACTGSRIDDGADALAGSASLAPGFAPVDRRFYKKGRAKQDAGAAEWSGDLARAVQGDMWRSVARLRCWAGVEVQTRDGGEAREDKFKGKEVHKEWEKAEEKDVIEEDGCVRIPRPRKWGRFVIEGEDGRVVVVDEDGVFDSGATDERSVWEEMKVPKVRYRYREKSRAEGDDKHEHKKKHSRRRRHSTPPAPPLKPLELMTEADSPAHTAVVDTVVSPTQFLTTGGKDEWALPSPSSERVFTLHSPARTASLLPSPIKSTLSVKPPKAITPKSTTTSATSSKRTRSERMSWVEAWTVDLPKSLSSAAYSDATSSTASVAALQQVGEAIRSRKDGSHKHSSRKSSNPASNASWEREVEAFEPRISHRSREPSHSSQSRLIPGRARDDMRTERKERGSAASAHSRTPTTSPPAHGELRVNKQRQSSPLKQSFPGLDVDQNSDVVEPYSWRREIEDLSAYSDDGSNGSRVVAPLPSPSPPRSRAQTVVKSGDDWNATQTQEEQHGEHADARSAKSQSTYKSHSTYKPPMVEDAPESSEVAGWTVAEGSVKDAASVEVWDEGQTKGASEVGRVNWGGSVNNWVGSEKKAGSEVESIKWGGSVAGSGTWKDGLAAEEDDETWKSGGAGTDWRDV